MSDTFEIIKIDEKIKEKYREITELENLKKIYESKY